MKKRRRFLPMSTPEDHDQRLNQSTEHLHQELTGKDEMGGMEKIPITPPGRS